MSFTPENSAWSDLTPAQEAEVAKMDPEQMKTFFRELAVQSGNFKRDVYSPDVLLATPQYARDVRLKKTVIVDGKHYEITADSEANLVVAETELYKQVFAAREQQQVTEPVEQPRDENDRFRERSEEEQRTLDAATESDLKLRMARGELSIADYLRQSPAAQEVFDERLREVGIDRQAIAEQQYAREWQESVRRWLQESTIGQRWEGGEANKQRILELLEANPELANVNTVEEKMASLDTLANYMRENNLIQPNPEIEAHRKIATTASFEEIKSAARKVSGIPEQSESSWFGR